jgi:hypothetical protein
MIIEFKDRVEDWCGIRRMTSSTIIPKVGSKVSFDDREGTCTEVRYSYSDDDCDIYVEVAKDV